jgi:hypothetical protein
MERPDIRIQGIRTLLKYDKTRPNLGNLGQLLAQEIEWDIFTVQIEDVLLNLSFLASFAKALLPELWPRPGPVSNFPVLEFGLGDLAHRRFETGLHQDTSLQCRPRSS